MQRFYTIQLVSGTIIGAVAGSILGVALSVFFNISSVDLLVISAFLGYHIASIQVVQDDTYTIPAEEITLLL